MGESRFYSQHRRIGWHRLSYRQSTFGDFGKWALFSIGLRLTRQVCFLSTLGMTESAIDYITWTREFGFEDRVKTIIKAFVAQRVHKQWAVALCSGQCTRINHERNWSHLIHSSVTEWPFCKCDKVNRPVKTLKSSNQPRDKRTRK